ncbi:MAG: hypothetical protein K2R98_32895 [Gemmataceae bacterium]|nr:hypothetical protein [Gemmataceae bacterium]
MRHRGPTALVVAGALAGIAAVIAAGADHRLQASSIFSRSTPPPQANTLAPRMILMWAVDSLDGPRPVPKWSGEGFIGPDGAFEMGPYGSVKVAGLTLDQARVAIERHLSRHIKRPRVVLRVFNARELPASEPATGPALPPASQTSPTGPPLVSSSEPPIAAAPAPPAWQPSMPQRPAVGLGTPGPLDGSAVVQGEWQPIPRGESPIVQNSTNGWRPVPRVSSGVQPVAYQAPMPAGPPETGTTPVSVQPELPSEDLKNFPPRPVPSGTPAGDGPSLEAGNCPGGICPPAAHGAPGGIGGPGPMGGPAPRECAKVSLPPYVIEPPDILIIESTLGIRDQPIRGQHLVRPDGTIGLGIYGAVYVAGMNLEQAKMAVWAVLSRRVQLPKDPETKKEVDPLQNISVDVLAYNSKYYYVITDGGGYGEQVVRLPITGSETVLDAIGQINGLPAVASKKDIWVARSFPCQGGHGSEQILPVDWCGIAQRGSTETNYQIMPGDRVYVKAQRIIRVDTTLAKVLSPVERIFGITLLGASTVNTIRQGGKINNNTGN